MEWKVCIKELEMINKLLKELENGNINLIIRWDNALHHREIKTYPQHKHIANKVLESFEITCEKILEVITLKLKKKNLQDEEL